MYVGESPKMPKHLIIIMHQLLPLKWNHKVLPWHIIEHVTIRASQGYLVIGWSHLDLVLNHRIEYVGCNTEAICTSIVQLPFGYRSQTTADAYCFLYNEIQLASMWPASIFVQEHCHLQHNHPHHRGSSGGLAGTVWVGPLFEFLTLLIAINHY